MNFPGKQKSSGSKEVDLNPLLPELFVLQGFSVRKNKSAKPFVSTVSHFCETIRLIQLHDYKCKKPLYFNDFRDIR